MLKNTTLYHKKRIFLISFLFLLLIPPQIANTQAKGGTIEIASLVDEMVSSARLESLAGNTDLLSTSLLIVSFGEYEDNRLPIEVSVRFNVRQKVPIEAENIEVTAYRSSVSNRTSDKLLETSVAYAVGSSGIKTAFRSTFIRPKVSSNQEGIDGIIYIMENNADPDKIDIAVKDLGSIFDLGTQTGSRVKSLDHQNYEILSGEKLISTEYYIDATFEGDIIGDFTFNEGDLLIQLMQNGETGISDLLTTISQNLTIFIILGAISIIIGIVLINMVVKNLSRRRTRR